MKASEVKIGDYVASREHPESPIGGVLEVLKGGRVKIVVYQFDSGDCISIIKRAGSLVLFPKGS